MNLGSFVKQNRERIAFSVKYDKSLDPGDKLSTVVLCEVDPPGELTAAPVLVSDDRVRIWVDDGFEDTGLYKITVLVDTHQGEQFEDEIFVQIVEI